MGEQELRILWYVLLHKEGRPKGNLASVGLAHPCGESGLVTSATVVVDQHLLAALDYWDFLFKQLLSKTKVLRNLRK